MSENKNAETTLTIPKLGDISAVNPALVDSNASIGSETSETAREEFALQFLTGGRQSSGNLNLSSKKKKKKAVIWSEKYENTSVVIGPVVGHDRFKDLVSIIKESCGEVKSHYFRDEQKCGFVYFYTDQNATKCKEQCDAFVFDGVGLKAKSPSTFFPNQSDGLAENFILKSGSSQGSMNELEPVPETQEVHTPAGTSNGTEATATIPSTGVVQSSPPSTTALNVPATQEPTPTLVIKNLCFGLKQEKFLEFMAILRSPPQSVSYHYDNNGLFRGVAFAKYNTAEQAAEALVELEGKEIGGRKLRVEFKRRTSGAQGSTSINPGQLKQQNSFGGIGSNSDQVENRRAPLVSRPPVSAPPGMGLISTAPIPTILLSGVDVRLNGSSLGSAPHSTLSEFAHGPRSSSPVFIPLNHSPTQSPSPSPPPTFPMASSTPGISPYVPRSSPLLPSPPGVRSGSPSTTVTTPFSVTPTSSSVFVPVSPFSGNSPIGSPALISPIRPLPPTVSDNRAAATAITTTQMATNDVASQSLFKVQPSGPILIREGMEFVEIIAERPKPFPLNGPPPSSSLNFKQLSQLGPIMPVLRAGLEFS